MSQELVKLATAELAKEKGFDWDCNHIYNGPAKAHGEPSKLKEHEGDGTGEVTNNGLDFNLEQYTPPIYCTAPAQSQLQKWLREKHEIDIDGDTTSHRKYSFLVRKYEKDPQYIMTDDYVSYEDALEAALQEALKLI